MTQAVACIHIIQVQCILFTFTVYKFGAEFTKGVFEFDLCDEYPFKVSPQSLKSDYLMRDQNPITSVLITKKRFHVLRAFLRVHLRP